jgi:hypothetical protein
MEGTAPIDASGTVAESDIPAFQDGIDLVNKMADSEDVQRCYVKQWFRFGYGRAETQADACTVQLLQRGFVERGGDVKELLVALTQTDAFLYRRAGGTP